MDFVVYFFYFRLSSSLVLIFKGDKRKERVGNYSSYGYIYIFAKGVYTRILICAKGSSSALMFSLTPLFIVIICFLNHPSQISALSSMELDIVA